MLRNIIKPFEVMNGESYVFRAEDFGDEGCKITLTDPRDLDMLDKDRHHAVILNKAELSSFRRWLADKFFIERT